MRLALVVVPVAVLAVVLVGVLGDDPPEYAGDVPGSPADPTAPGRLRIEIGGDAPPPHPTRDAGDIPPPPPPPPPEPEPRTHVVEDGDTLRGLAREYYGDPERWTDIQKANELPDTVIRKGQTLVIPR